MLLVAALVLIARVQGGPPQPATPVQPVSTLHVAAVKFEPVRQGRNVVGITITNTGRRNEFLSLDIYTQSPDYGRGIAWGTQFPETIGAAETKELRFVYWVYGPLTDKTTITLSFYNPPSPDKVERASRFDRRQYSGPGLPRALATSVQPAARATDSERAEVVEVLRTTQLDMKANRHSQAWQSFSRDLCAVSHCKTEADFVKNIATEQSPMRRFIWPVDRFLRFEPAAAMIAVDGRVVLLGTADADLKIYFTRESGRWKIDEIGGYVSRAELAATWEQRLLPTMESRRTEHFDLFYARGSTAAQESEHIAAEREAGYKAIADLFGVLPDIRIRLVFFEDAETKERETGHRGAGLAYDRTIVEVFNSNERLDPFHEVCHIVAGTIGDPPALFNEGGAVYVSERLGAHALKSLGGGVLPVDERVREIRARHELIPLDTLVRLTDIGPDESRPTIAYPEAASFVKFLVQQFGKDKFLAAYKSLKNSDDKTTQEQNLASLRNIYGTALSDLEARWLKAIGL